MANLSLFARNSVALQADMFRLAKNEHGLSVKVLSRRTGISASTIDGWASGETAMPAWALGELGLPDDLTSLVLDPYSRSVVTDGPSEGGVHDAARDSGEFNVAYMTARHPDSEGGEVITPRERAQMADIHRRLATRRVAA